MRNTAETGRGSRPHPFRKTGLGPVLLALAFLAPAAAPAETPTDSFSANLDAQCEPADVVDWLRSELSAETFWREQRADFEALVRSGEKNLENSRYLRDDNVAGRAAFEAEFSRRAAEEGTTGSALAKLVRDAMADYDDQRRAYEKAIDDQTRELDWARRCLAVARGELGRLGVR